MRAGREGAEAGREGAEAGREDEAREASAHSILVSVSEPVICLIRATARVSEIGNVPDRHAQTFSI